MLARLCSQACLLQVSATVYTAPSLTQGLALAPATHADLAGTFLFPKWQQTANSRDPRTEASEPCHRLGEGQLLPTQHLCDSMCSRPDGAPLEEPGHVPSAFSPREARLFLRRGAADPAGPSPPVPEGGRYRERPQERQTSTEQTLVQKALGTRLVSG